MSAIAKETARLVRGSGFRLLETLETWAERRHQRRRLAEMPCYLLKDMGLSTADVEMETSKPMWRP